jgi:predicted nucleic acid-binding protein
VNLFVDTSVWSLALRRDGQSVLPEVKFLKQALATGAGIFTTGLVLQELLQGFAGQKSRDAIIEHFAPLPFIVPRRDDHIAAAELRSACRRSGLQIGTIDALFARLCMAHSLVILTTDIDFERLAKLHPLKVWQP